MPYELLIPLYEPKVTERLGLAEQQAMHAVFLRILQAADSQLATAVHDVQDKPFTQSIYRHSETGVLTWRLTLLDDALYQPLMNGITRVSDIHFQNQPLTFDWGAVQCQHQSYLELAETQPIYRFRLRFQSPTTFKQRIMHQPLPNPYNCFKSWWRRWQVFAPVEWQINIAALDIVHEHVAVAQYAMHSITYTNDKHIFTGGVGTMEFVGLITKKVEDAWWQKLATLAAFAPYCGTGSKTAWGLGQTILLLK